MSNIFKRMFPALFGDPAEEAFARRMRINSALQRFRQEVRKQDGFINRYIQQEEIHERTGDAVSHAQVMKMLKVSFQYRRFAQYSLNALTLISTIADQMEAYKGFCEAVIDISRSMGSAPSIKDVVGAQKQLRKGLANAKTAETMMDQMLQMFGEPFEVLMPAETDNDGVDDESFNKAFAKLKALKKSNSWSEDDITSALNDATN